jgi:predicted transcriptional regulator
MGARIAVTEQHLVDTRTLTERDFDLAAGLVEQLHDAGRLDEADALYRLVVAAERAGLRPSLDISLELTAEELLAIDEGEADLAAGRIIPDHVVHQGPDAVREYMRKREAGEITLDPQAQAAVEAFRREREARLGASGVDA